MVSPLPDEYRLELTVVRPDALERDVHIPVLGDHPYLTLELRPADASSPDVPAAADAGADLPVVAVRAGGLGDDPAALGRLLVQIGTTLEESPHAS